MGRQTDRHRKLKTYLTKLLKQSLDMGSMGFMLADWNIELIRSRKKKEKKLQKKNKLVLDTQIQTEGTFCTYCTESSSTLEYVQGELRKENQDMKQISEILNQDDGDKVVESVMNITSEIDILKYTLKDLQEENKDLSERMNGEKILHDNTQNEKIKSLEIEMAEKENQLLRTSNNVRGQLATAKQEVNHLSKEVEKFDNFKNVSESGTWQQEAESLQLVLGMKKQELDKLKAANNFLLLELERLGVVELQLQVEKQKTEEMSSVLCVKNEQMHQVLDEYEALQHQLEIEVASHRASQQELEKIQWTNQAFLGEEKSGSKEWKNRQNKKQSTGNIGQVVQKEKGIAYSFNC